MENKKALVGMSGGVDSSVAAFLMQRQGYDCIGVTMRLYDSPTEESTCCSLDDVEDARAVATRLGIRHYVFNFKDDFDRQVIQKFVTSYEQGLTPNPCIDCNRYLKFDRLLRRARELGCQWVVSGHYARIRQENGRYLLYKAADRAKDQTYFLACLNQEQLSHIRFPLGDLTKTQVREIAGENGFVNARKRDSQDICFVPDGDYVAFLRRYGGVKPVPGDFVDQAGHVLGRHKGLECYTTGQRKGLGVSADTPLYVLRKELDTGRVILGPNSDLFTRELTAERINWISIPELTAPMSVTAKTRYSQREASAVAEPLPGGRIHVVFEEPQRAITAGQAVVLYDGERVVGGGTICG